MDGQLQLYPNENAKIGTGLPSRRVCFASGLSAKKKAGETGFELYGVGVAKSVRW